MYLSGHFYVFKFHVPFKNTVYCCWAIILSTDCLPLPSTGDEASETLDGVRWTFTSSVGEVSLICKINRYVLGNEEKNNLQRLY